MQYLAADAITMYALQSRRLSRMTLTRSICRIKSLFQIFEDGPLDFVLPILEGFIADKADRHKQRAAGELIGGALSFPSLFFSRS